jgi:hypothetical protein
MKTIRQYQTVVHLIFNDGDQIKAGSKVLIPLESLKRTHFERVKNENN